LASARQAPMTATLRAARTAESKRRIPIRPITIAPGGCLWRATPGHFTLGAAHLRTIW
jgi:hypothetical protein